MKKATAVRRWIAITFASCALSVAAVTGLQAGQSANLVMCRNAATNAYPDTVDVPITVTSTSACGSRSGTHYVDVVDEVTGTYVSQSFVVTSNGQLEMPGQSPSTNSPYSLLVYTWSTSAYTGNNWVNYTTWDYPWSDPNPSFPPWDGDTCWFTIDYGGSLPTPLPSSPTLQPISLFTYNGFQASSGPYQAWINPTLTPVRTPITTVQPVTLTLGGQAPNCPYGCQGGDGGCNCGGMAVASLDRFQAGIALTDTPISYTPPVGPAMNFTVYYHQRLSNQPATFNFSNLGPQWQYSWISYIAGGPTNGQLQAINFTPNGSQYTYTGYQEAVVQAQGATLINQGSFVDPQGWTHGSLQYLANPSRYQLTLPDGTVQVYGLVVGSSPNQEFFLTSSTDPQGNVTTINYSPEAAASGNAVITSVVDPQGNSLNFSYDTVHPLQITKVTRSLDGLSALFGYNSSGQLNSITDTIGMTSSFQYTTVGSNSNFISSLTTPYGTSTFNSSDGTGYLEADMTNPLGQHERVEYQESLSSSDVPDWGASVPSASGLNIDSTNTTQASSYYWNRRAMADAAAGSITTDSAGFYALAQISKWAETPAGSIPVPLSAKKRLEGRVWYNYPGQPDADHVDLTASGSTASPSVTARLLDGGATQATFASYNVNGMITQSIDPVGRTTNYTYSTNDIDLTEVSQTDGTNQDILSTMTYNSQHEPLTATDASGQTTTMTYNSLGQLLTRENALSQTTTLVYAGPSGSGTGDFLHTVTGPVSGSTTTYTYDSAGRTSTMTDSEGYELTYAYDNLDRVVSVTYPNSTTDQTIYHNLDVAETIDRQSRPTYHYYDAIREMVQPS